MKKKLSLEDLQRLKDSGFLNDGNSHDIEINGEEITGGKSDTVDTHWPTTADTTNPNED